MFTLDAYSLRHEAANGETILVSRTQFLSLSSGIKYTTVSEAAEERFSGGEVS